MSDPYPATAGQLLWQEFANLIINVASDHYPYPFCGHYALCDECHLYSNGHLGHCPECES